MNVDDTVVVQIVGFVFDQVLIFRTRPLHIDRTVVNDRVASYHVGNGRLLVLFVIVRAGRGNSQRLSFININNLVFEGIPIRRPLSADSPGQRPIHTPVIINPRGIGRGQTERQRRADSKRQRTLFERHADGVNRLRIDNASLDGGTGSLRRTGYGFVDGDKLPTNAIPNSSEDPIHRSHPAHLK